ncbi:MAG: LytTR family DNA-binding domain-containing protein [Butyrivibrio sp.]|nr:LytTR family DNA-binding domain-containing protein [Butyrivibrio sp.]
MRIAVCDDCAEDALFLKKCLSGHEVNVYSGADSLLSDMGKAPYDLYLLDIFMGDSMDGIELAKRLREVNEEAVICFISSSNEFYREAYDLYAIQYLIKPVQEEALNKLLLKVQKNLDCDGGKKLSYSWRGKVGSVPYGKIRYISSRGHTLSIYCMDGSMKESAGKLSDLEKQVCGEILMRCHQSFIVNLNHVEGMDGTDLIIAGERIPISRRYYDEVRKRYRETLFDKVFEKR